MSLLRSKRRTLTADELEVWNEWNEKGEDWVVHQVNPATGNTFYEDWWGQGLIPEIDPDTGAVKWSKYKQALDEEHENKNKKNEQKEWRTLTDDEHKSVLQTATLFAAPIGCILLIPGLALVLLGVLVIFRALTNFH